MRTRNLIAQFAADYPGPMQVRGKLLAREMRQTELRTRKHDHLAVIWDDLGNAFVLTRTGMRQQLLHNEINR
jgi:hypothetical protein